MHLSHLGHPIVGDKIYGPNEKLYLQFIETGWTDTNSSVICSCRGTRSILRGSASKADSIGKVRCRPDGVDREPSDRL